jgi:hypothetical protein
MFSLPPRRDGVAPPWFRGSTAFQSIKQSYRPSRSQLGMKSLRSASTSISTVSGSGTSTTTDAMLSAIIKRLNAMDDKLKALNPLREKVTSLEASDKELGTQQVTLIVVVERVDVAHAALNAKINRVEAGQRPPPQDRQKAHGRGCQGDLDCDQGGEVIPTAHKLKFPKYDGTGDPLP